MRRKWKLVFIIPAAILGMMLFAFIGGKVVELLWNWLLPPLFGFHQVTFWQALGLLVLSRILFGGSGLHRSRRSGPDFTPEQKARFRQRMRGFGFGPEAAAGEGGASPP